MKNLTRWVLFASIAVALSAVVFNFGPVASSQSSRKGERSKINPNSPSRSGLENFDIRIKRADDATASSSTQKGGGLAVDARKQVLATQAQRESAAVVQQSIRAAHQQLNARVPALRVNYSAALRVPEIVRVEGAGVLSSAAGGSKESALRGFISENAAFYGLTRQQAAQLTKVSDYTNPAGNLSFVELEQEINGLPVFQGFVRGVLTPDGELVSTVSLLAAGMRPSALDTTPQLDPAEAVAAGIKSINLKVNPASLSVLDTAADGKSHVVSRGPLDEDTQARLMYFPLVPGHAVLAYSMTLWGPANSYYVFIDANTGELLWRKNITQDQQTPYTYNIYDNDSPTPSAPVRSSLVSPTNSTPSEPQPPGITRTDVTLISESPFDNLGWIPDSAGPNAPTTGNNVDAGLDRVAPNGIDPAGRATATNFVFRFDYRPDGSADPTGSNDPLNAQFQMGAVTNLFFWSNRYHDSLYHLGFTEAARNFQQDNFGRGGLGNDRVRAEAQDSSGTNNANFNTPADGQPPRMQMFLWPGTPTRDGDLDQEVMYHELTHGTSNRLHANASGLGSDTAQGMGEGWSDFYAISLLAIRTPDGDDGKRLYAMGAYDTRNYYRAIRRFPYAVKSAVAANGRSHNPLTLADIDPAQINVSDAAFPVAPGQATQVHNQGEVWCSALIEVRAKLIEKLGFANGSQRVLQIVTDGMKLDPVNPTMLDARDSILAADCAGFNGGDELDIWEGFRIRGMGFRAATSGIHVTESFEGPNLKLLPITVTEVPGSSNGNGVIDPGETARLTVPLQNILCSVTVPSATATLSPGGNTATYPAFAPGAVNTQTIDYTVPVETACGSSVPLTITVNSTLGPITYNYNLNIGQASPLAPYEYFDNMTPPALPYGWTTQRTGAGMPWVTSSTRPDTPPNSAFTTNPTNAGTSDLISPTFPVNTALAQVSFRNLYNLEDNFDGMQLHIKIGNQAFREIISAGGSFVTGGYNGEINDGAAWTGLSAGTTANPAYITSTVNLPPSANNQLVQLKWTVIGDANTIAPGESGARIDTVQLSTTAQACTPFGVETVSLSGRIMDSGGNPVPNIQVTLSGTTNATATTGADGRYSFPNLVSGGDYTVAPTTPGYEYTPPSRTYNDLTTDVSDADFTVVLAASISGYVTTQNGTQGIDGITVTLSGTESRVTVTSNGGFYSFQGLTRGGDYTVTPSGGNNTFTPPSRTYNDLQGPVTDANFIASENLSCEAVAPTINGQIAAGDPTQPNRIFRDGTPTTCTNTPFPGTNADPSPVNRRYDQYNFTNTSASPACIRVTFRADNAGIHSVAYLGSYNPANISQNYLGDSGAAYTANTFASYSFTVPAGATYVVVMHEITPNTPATINYSLAVCDSTGQTTQPAPVAKVGQVLISEFRQSGVATPAPSPSPAPSPFSPNDEYVELYNNTDGPIDIGGFAIATNRGGDFQLGLPAGIIIPRRGHLIVVNSIAGSGYSLTAYAPADLSIGTLADVFPENQGLALLDASRTTVIDSVGFTGNGGSLPYIEGNGLRPTGQKPAVQYAYVRRTSPITNFPQDTGDSASDWLLVSVTGDAFPGQGTGAPPVQTILGAPGPENRSSPVDRSAFIPPTLVDPTAPVNGGENRRRLGCGAPNTPPCDANTSSFGFLSLRRKFTNNTGANVTRLRFRITDVTTKGSPGDGAGQADLRALSSTTIVVTVNGVPTTVEGTTLEQPPNQPIGGGINSSLSVGTITFGAPLANGQSINVQFLLGVQRDGNFRFVVNTEALP
jgi:hypothetical protein